MSQNRAGASFAIAMSLRTKWISIFYTRTKGRLFLSNNIPISRFTLELESN